VTECKTYLVTPKAAAKLELLFNKLDPEICKYLVHHWGWEKTG